MSSINPYNTKGIVECISCRRYVYKSNTRSNICNKCIDKTNRILNNNVKSKF